MIAAIKPILAYETPLWTEQRRLPKSRRIFVLSMAAILMAFAPVMDFLFIHLNARFPHLVPATCISIALLGCASTSLRGTVQVFADRIDVRIVLGLFRFWSRRYAWGEIVECDA